LIKVFKFFGVFENMYGRGILK